MSNRKPLDRVNVIDLEATSWESNDSKPPQETSEIIEIGISVLNTENFEVENSTSILVNPEHSSVSPFCTELTTLTPEMVAKGVSFPEALKRLKREFLTDRRLWVSWGDYDRVQFERNCRLYKIRYPFGRRHMSVKTLYSVGKGLTHEVGMAEALKQLDIPLEGTHHRGGDDARNIAKIFAHLLRSLRA